MLVGELFLCAMLVAGMNATPPPKAIEGADDVNKIHGQYLVIFSTPDASSSKEERMAHISKKIKEMTKNSAKLKLQHGFKFAKKTIVTVYTDSEEAVNELFGVDGVEAIEFNTVLNPLASCMIQNTGSTIWGLTRISTRKLPTNWASLSYSYPSEGDGSNTYAYVLDSGVQKDHIEFNGRVLPGYVVNSITSTGEDDTDGYGHGTHCAGTIGSTTYGVAKNAFIIPVKAFNAAGQGTTVDLVEAAEWILQDIEKNEATNPAYKAVASLSLVAKPSKSVDNAITALTDHGIPVVAAAGNDGTDACNFSPAHLPDVITVSASAKTDKIPSFANYGTCVKIMAPGNYILSTIPGNLTAIKSGTSYAAPHVTGAICRMMSALSYRPSLAEVFDYLNATSTYDELIMGNYPTTPNKLLYAAC